MKISLALHAVVSGYSWSKPDFRSKWEKFLKGNFSDVNFYIVGRGRHNSLSKIKLKIVDNLNRLTKPSTLLVNLNHTSIDEFRSFLLEMKSNNSDFLLSESSGGNVRDFFSKKLFFGHKTAPYSPIKLLPYLLCYNLNPADISLRSDLSLIHLANLLGLQPKFLNTRKGKKRQYLHAITQKLAHFISPSRPAHIPSTNAKSMVGAGTIHKGKTFITHTTLRHQKSAANSFTQGQLFTIFSLVSFFILGLVLYPIPTMIAFTGVLSTIYFVDVLFNLFLVGKSIHTPPELSFTEDQIKALKDKDLPIYTILVPLYKEANVLEGFVESMAKMDYPKSKLDVILLLEADDTETIEKAKFLKLPKYIRSLVVPHSSPKTKPKACNYGLSFAKGEYAVIYDAEDQPDPAQLKKAILGFRASPPEVGCLQAKLNYHNKDQNLLTRFFTAEYSLWFDVVLPGLQSINTAIPLGGTSNHFRVQDLITFQGWDAFNVTEDADLGSRLFKAGFRTAIIDSVTLEEANSRVGNWVRQRSRWIKGYMQTFLVHNRDFKEFFKTQGVHAIIFQLTVGGKIAFMLINPLLWIATISYFVFYSIVGPTIESFYPPIVFYMAAFSLVFGNFLFIYYYMIGVAKHGHWSLVKFIFLVPLYWLMISRAALKALYQLFFNPHYWEKTIHGLHLKKVKVVEEEKQKKISLKVPEVIKRAYYHNHSGSVMLIVSSILASVFNFLYNAYLGYSVSFEQFGLVSLFSSFFYLTQLPFSIFDTSVTHITALVFGKNKKTPLAVLEKFSAWSTNTSVALTILWLISIPFLSYLFKSETLLPFFIFSPIWIIGIVSAVNSGFLKGIHRFKVIALLMFVESASKLLITFILINFALKPLVYLALPLSILSSFLVGLIYIRKIKQTNTISNDAIDVKFPVKFAGTILLNKISLVVLMGLDIVIAKIVLSPEDAGKFALISLIGKMLFFFSSLTSQLILPMVSKEEGADGDPNKVFSGILNITILFSTISYLFLGVFGKYLVPIFFGEKMNEIVAYLPYFLLGVCSYTIANCILEYHQSRRKYFITTINFFVSLIQIPILFRLTSTLQGFVFVMSTFGIVQLFIIAVAHRLTRYSTALSQNSYAFFSLFKKQKVTPREFTGQLRFLILNWRDTKHKWAGGAESYVHELAKNLVDKGHQVTIFSGNDGKSSNREIIDGIEVIRRGGFFMVYIWAAIYYVFKFQDRFDIIIDSENGVPFFTPLYSRRPKFLLMHHVHQEVFNNSLKFPLREFAKFLEGKLMPLVYRNEKVMAVSESTREDVLKLGIFKPENVCVVNPGIDLEPLKTKIAKTVYPSLLYLGRLKDYKNVDIAIKAFAKLRKSIPKAIFNIAGEGECEEELKNLVKQLGIEGSVNFLGRVSDKERTNLYATSWLMVQPSSHEGWGITVIEANFYGCPVVASDIAGLRDSVVDGKTGILVKPKSVIGFSKAILKIFKRPILREKMSALGIERAKKFNWSENTTVFLKKVDQYLVLKLA